MKLIAKIMVLAMVLSFAGIAQVQAAKGIGGMVVAPGKVFSGSGPIFVVSVSQDGAMSVKQVTPSFSSSDCDGFCGEVCGTGQVDVCYCGGQSFPCTLYEPPVCDVKSPQ